MSTILSERPLAASLAERLARPRGDGVSLFWLGQAGFVIDLGRLRILLDPYLSDTLAQKYAGTPHPHERMMPAPVSLEALGPLDLVLCTHQHTDHMDPGTLAPLALLQPTLRFVVPAATLEEARRRIGVGDDRLIGLDAGAIVEPLQGLVVRAVRAAHETLERDTEGRHRFLGYGITGGGATIFHSGDSISFEGQAAEVAGLGADLALLPVNGRSAALRDAGFAGNLDVPEAVALCRETGIPSMIAHHYGMFAFNTANPADIDAAAAAAAPFALHRARPGVEYRLETAREVSAEGFR